MDYNRHIMESTEERGSEGELVTKIAFAGGIRNESICPREVREEQIYFDFNVNTKKSQDSTAGFNVIVSSNGFSLDGRRFFGASLDFLNMYNIETKQKAHSAHWRTIQKLKEAYLKTNSSNL